MTNTNNWRDEFDSQFPANIQFNYLDIPDIKTFIEQVEQDAIQRTEEKWKKKIEEAYREVTKPKMTPEELQNNLMTKL
jgi:hypothetical protein